MLDRISVRIPQHEVGVSEYRGPTIVPCRRNLRNSIILPFRGNPETDPLKGTRKRNPERELLKGLLFGS